MKYILSISIILILMCLICGCYRNKSMPESNLSVAGRSSTTVGEKSISTINPPTEGASKSGTTVSSNMVSASTENLCEDLIMSSTGAKYSDKSQGSTTTTSVATHTTHTIITDWYDREDIWIGGIIP